MKAIAGAGQLPFNLGGFLVDAANIKGVMYEDLNIYQQRSDVMFDLIDKDGTIHQFVQLVYKDANGQPLDVTKSNSVLQGEIMKNSFFIKSTDTSDLSFIIAFQLNKVKLSNGTVNFKPFPIRSGDATQGAVVDPASSTFTAASSSIQINNPVLCTITLLSSLGTPVVLSSGITVQPGTPNAALTIGAVDYTQSSSGTYTFTVDSTAALTTVLTAKAGSVTLSSTVSITFTP